MADVNLGPGVLNLWVRQGDTRVLPLEFRDAAGDPVVLPTSGWLAQVRRTPDQGALLFTITVDASSGASGDLELTIDAPVIPPGSYFWDLEVTDSGDVRTWLGGVFVLEGDVSRA